MCVFFNINISKPCIHGDVISFNPIWDSGGMGEGGLWIIFGELFYLV